MKPPVLVLFLCIFVASCRDCSCEKVERSVLLHHDGSRVWLLIGYYYSGDSFMPYSKNEQKVLVLTDNGRCYLGARENLSDSLDLFRGNYSLSEEDDFLKINVTENGEDTATINYRIASLYPNELQLQDTSSMQILKLVPFVPN